MRPVRAGGGAEDRWQVGQFAVFFKDRLPNL